MQGALQLAVYKCWGGVELGTTNMSEICQPSSQNWKNKRQQCSQNWKKNNKKNANQAHKIEKNTNHAHKIEKKQELKNVNETHKIDKKRLEKCQPSLQNWQIKRQKCSQNWNKARKMPTKLTKLIKTPTMLTKLKKKEKYLKDKGFIVLGLPFLHCEKSNA